MSDEVVLSMPDATELVEHLAGWHGVEVTEPATAEDVRLIGAEHRMRHEAGVAMRHVHTHKGMSHP